MFGSSNKFTGLSGMLGSTSSNSGFNPNQADTDTLFKSLGIGTTKNPVKTVKKTAGDLGLGMTLGGSARRDIKQDAKAGKITDPVQYTLNLINKAKTQNMSNSQQWVNQPTNPVNPNYTGTRPSVLPLGTPTYQPYSLNTPTTTQTNTINPTLLRSPSLAGAGVKTTPWDQNQTDTGIGSEGLYDDSSLDTGGGFDEWDSNSYAGGNDSGTGTYSGAYDNSRSTNPNAIDAYAEDWMSDYNTGNVPTAEELRASGINLNKLRNAIATGMIDPYNLGVGSNIPFTYDQLKGIESGLAKSMDPAITDIQARIATADKREAAGTGTGYSFGSNPALDVILGSGKFTKDQKNLIIQSIQAGSDPATVILNQAKNIMGGPESSAVTKSEQALGSMKELDSLLKQFYASGGKSSLLSGKYENVLNRLGTLKDPNLAGLGVSIAIALQKYRNAVSGTAFSVQEGQEMKSVFPSISNTKGLNDVITKSRLNALQNDIDTAYRTVLGPAYDSLKSQNVSNSSSSIRVINGTQYQMNPSDGKWYPLTKVGGGTNSASNVNSLQDAMRRIARNESDGSGGYKAVGPVVTKGMYKGQRAIGKYQVMQGNIAPWSKEILGYSVTPQQFYNNPQLQDKIVAGKMQQIYKKYGNWADVASVWFTGGPRSYGANKKDVLGTSGAQYVNKFLS